MDRTTFGEWSRRRFGVGGSVAMASLLGLLVHEQAEAKKKHIIHNGPPFTDANSNPATDPVHTFHVGLWFNAPDDAEAAGCPITVTPFNGAHTAGIQALKAEPVNGFGPLAQLES